MTCVATNATYALFQVGEVSLAEAAKLARVPYRTWARWVERWAFRRVNGIRVVTARARGGRRYVVDPEFVERWRNQEIATPYR